MVLVYCDDGIFTIYCPGEEKRRIEKGRVYLSNEDFDQRVGKCVSSAAARREVSMNTRDTGSLQLLFELILDSRRETWVFGRVQRCRDEGDQ